MCEGKSKYSKGVLSRVRRNLGVDENSTLCDEKINNMPRNKVLTCCMTWEGIIGYEHMIKDLVENIYKVELKEE